MSEFEDYERAFLDITVSVRSQILLASRMRYPLEQTMALRITLEELRTLGEYFFRVLPRRLEILDSIITKIEELLKSDNREWLSRRFRISPNRREISPIITARFSRLAEDSGVEVGYACEALLRLMTELRHEYPRLEIFEEPPRGGRANLGQLVPRQKIAPVQFIIDGNRLRVQHTPARSFDEAKNVAGAARDVLVDQGQSIIDLMARSNCDPRFVETVRSLQEKLVDAADIVQLGIMCITCEEMRRQYGPELPDTISAKLSAHFRSVNMYVAQFPDWAIFTENAAAVELSEDDIRQSTKTAAELVEQLSSVPEHIDEEVPKTIAVIRSAVGSPAKATKKAAFALIRTIENLFAAIADQAALFTSETIEETRKNTSKWGGRALAGFLVAVMLSTATAMLPTYTKLADASWVRQAIEIIQKDFPKKLLE